MCSAEARAQLAGRLGHASSSFHLQDSWSHLGSHPSLIAMPPPMSATAACSQLKPEPAKPATADTTVAVDEVLGAS